MAEKKSIIEEANKNAAEKMISARPVLKDVRPAKDVIPNMTKNTILHAGPPITWDRVCSPMKGGILGAVVYEKLAKDFKEAEHLIKSGEVVFSPCHHHNVIGTMAGITSASMPVFVVEDKVNGNTVYANIREETVKALRYGFYDENVQRKLEWNAKTLGPVISEALKISGGIDMINLIAQSLHMGDDGHNKNTAENALFALKIMPSLVKTNFSSDELSEVATWMNVDDRFISTAVMAACKSVCKAAEGIPNSSVVTVMCRNGTDFGIRVSALGDTWFTAPSPRVEALYFPGFGPEDAGLDMGDSCVTETAGIGAFAMAAAPSMVEFVGGTVEDSISYTKEMFEITVTKNQNFTIAYLDFAGTPTGIDIMKVVRTGIQPIINTSISHKDAGVGQVGAGMTRAPLECFKKALGAFGEKMNV